MNKSFARALLTALGGLSLGIALPASADHEYEDRYQYDYANVTRVQPIVRYVSVETPVRECRIVEEAYRPRRRSGNVAGAAIVGGIIGGVIGNQFGSGSGRDAATAAGVVLGSSIAADSAKASSRRGAPRSTRRMKHCDITYETHEEEKIDGYRVTYVFRGVEYTTRMRSRPGDRIKVRVMVEPVSRD